MTYDEAIEWLLSFADFERSGRFQDRPDVAPMLALLERLGNPHLGRTTVHIAGSKGKGSVAAMVAAIADQECPGSVSLYTSPHLYSYTERIADVDDPITKDEFTALVGQNLKPAVEAIESQIGERSLVTFDLLTALFFAFSKNRAALMQVLETGLGGRVDSTNVFAKKEVAVLTPISLEHTAILGDTAEQIAREKAAIITRRCKVIMAPQPNRDAGRVIRDFANAATARMVDVSAEYHWKRVAHDLHGQDILIEGPDGIMIKARIPLLGAHQIENAATSVATMQAIHKRRLLLWVDTSFDRNVITGLASVRWPCRIEVVREDPLVIVDGAHNRDSARRLAETLAEYFTADRVLFVIGCGSDKDIDGLAKELSPLASRVLAVRSEHPRAMDPQRITEAFGRLNVDSEIVNNVPTGVDSALAATSDAGFTLICVAGSLFVAAEARAHVLGVRT